MEYRRILTNYFTKINAANLVCFDLLYETHFSESTKPITYTVPYIAINQKYHSNTLSDYSKKELKHLIYNSTIDKLYSLCKMYEYSSFVLKNVNVDIIRDDDSNVINDDIVYHCLDSEEHKSIDIHQIPYSVAAYLEILLKSGEMSNLINNDKLIKQLSHAKDEKLALLNQQTAYCDEIKRLEQIISNNDETFKKLKSSIDEFIKM